MTIDIPLSPELLSWWIKNLVYDVDKCEYIAPLPIRLDFDGQSIDLGKAGIRLSHYIPDDEPRVKGHVSVSSSEPDAQALMFGLEYMRDGVSFSLSPDEVNMIKLICFTAETFANRALKEGDGFDAYETMFNDHSKDE